MSFESHRLVKQKLIKQAKAMRMTDSERKLWKAIRQLMPIEGTHFRRQVPLGPYIVDFCCMTARLIVELDGNQHGTDIAQARDAKRTRDLEALGFRVIRFANEDVNSNIQSVLDTIAAALPAPNPNLISNDRSVETQPYG